MNDLDTREMAELNRLLIPVYGFGSRDAAEAYISEAYEERPLMEPQTIADRDSRLGYVMIPGW